MFIGYNSAAPFLRTFKVSTTDKEGNNIEAVINVINEAQRLSGNGKPICIIMHTEMGNGVDYMMGSHKWHGVAPQL